MKKTKKTVASVALAGMIAAMLPFNALAATGVTTDRIYGTDRFQTAINVSDKFVTADTAILAPAANANLVDALAAAPLAGTDAPILLTENNALTATTKAQLIKLGVTKVYVVGAISDAVLAEVNALPGVTATALKGADRIGTAEKINAELANPSGTFVVGYYALADALSVSSFAAANNYSIVVANPDGSLPASASLSAANVYIIGGPTLVKDVAGAERLYGLDRFATNKKVIDTLTFTYDKVYVANGTQPHLVDSLVASSLAAKTLSPIVLTDTNVGGDATAATVASKLADNAVVTGLGGATVVTNNTLGKVAGTVQVGDVELAITSVTALDDTNKYLEIIFSQPVFGLQASDITLQNADTMARYGIKDVKMSSNGLTATVELYAQDDAEEVLAYLQDYNVTVNVDGTTLKFTFNRPYSFKVRVHDINVGDKEIVAYVDKGNSASVKVTLDVPDKLNFDYQAAMGELVQVWYNGENELVKYQILTKTGITDSIEITDVDEIKLLGEDEKYDVSTEEYGKTSKDKFAFYVDGEKEDIEDFVDEKFNFAKVGFDTSGDIEFVSAYSLKDVLIVDSIDDDEVVGIEGSGSFDAEDATIVKDGKVIALDELKKGDLLFYSDDADDEDGYAQVLNNKIASGEIEEVYSDSIEVDGDVYDFVYDEDIFEYELGNAVYINEDGDVDTVDSDAAEELQAAGDVALYGDYAGNLIYISGDLADVDSNAKIAVLTEDILGYTTARDKVEIDVLTEDEKELSFDMNLEDFDTIIVDGEEYEIDNGSGAKSDWNATFIKDGSKVTGITLDDNATATDEAVKVMFTGADVAGDAGSLVKLHLDDNGNLEELEFFSDDDDYVGAATIGTSNSVEAGDKYVNGKKLTSNTIMFDATDDGKATDADDYIVSNFGDYKGAEIDSGHYIYNDDAEVVAIWFDKTTNDDFTYDEAVITKVLRNTDKEIVSVTVYAGGEEKTIKVDEVKDSSIVKGQVVVLEFDEDNTTLVKGFATDAKDIDENFSKRVITGATVTKVDVSKKEVVTDKGTFKLADKGLVLDATDDSDITIERLTDLRNEKNVTIVRDAKTGSYVKLFVIEPEGKFSTVALTTAIEDAEKAQVGVEVSTDGADVEKGTMWVTAAVKAKLVTAIETATEAKDAAKTNADVDAAVAVLNAAVVVYEAAQADGAKIDEDTQSINGTHSLQLGFEIVEVALSKADVVKVTVNGEDAAFGGTDTVVRIEAKADATIVITTADTVYHVNIQ